MRLYDVKTVLDSTEFRLRLFSNPLKHKNIWNNGRHCNADYEIHIIIEGNCELDIEDKLLSLSKGSAVIIAPGCYHKPEFHDYPFERMSFSVSISGGKWEEQLSSAVSTYLSFEVDEDTVSLCKKIYKELLLYKPFSRDLFRINIEKLLIFLLRSMITDLSEQSDFTPSYISRTDYIDGFFERRFSEYGTEDELAREMHLSKRQLTRVIQKQYGMSFRQKLLCARMDYAGFVLRTTDLNIEEICEKTGYNSETTFYKNFKSYYKTTPRMYRLNYKIESKKDIKN